MRPILIAECAQSHNGRREILKRMIHESAANGADYAKIQAARSRELTHRVRFDTGLVDDDGTVRVIKRPYHAEVERLSRLDLSLDDEAWFVEECRRAGIGSMITVFTRSALREVGPLGFDALKVASFDCASFPLLRDVRGSAGRIVVSTGVTYDSEIERAAEILAGTGFIFLHCVSLYPTPMHEMNLRRMSWLRRFTERVGLSEHTETARDGLWASKIALAHGADAIERHITVLDPAATKDGPVSITTSDLGELRAFGDLPRAERMQRVIAEYPDWETTLGSATRPLSHAELLNRDYYCGRFATKIGGRDVFNWEDVDLDAVAAAERARSGV
jgi:sialic acid synthase SpsE